MGISFFHIALNLLIHVTFLYCVQLIFIQLPTIYWLKYRHTDTRKYVFFTYYCFFVYLHDQEFCSPYSIELYLNLTTLDEHWILTPLIIKHKIGSSSVSIYYYYFYFWMNIIAIENGLLLSIWQFVMIYGYKLVLPDVTQIVHLLLHLRPYIWCICDRVFEKFRFIIKKAFKKVWYCIKFQMYIYFNWNERSQFFLWITWTLKLKVSKRRLKSFELWSANPTSQICCRNQSLFPSVFFDRSLKEPKQIIKIIVLIMF